MPEPGVDRMSVIGRDQVQKARDALDVALRSRDQSPRLYRGAMRAAMENLDAALATDRGAVGALHEAVALLDALVDADDLPLDVGDRLDGVRRDARRLGGQ